jgi:hypothetical protein
MTIRSDGIIYVYFEALKHMRREIDQVSLHVDQCVYIGSLDQRRSHGHMHKRLGHQCRSLKAF